MSMQKRSDERSMALHKEIVKKLRADASLWEIPKRNIVRWKTTKGRQTLAEREWEHILDSKTEEQILSILEGDSEESVRLRSSSPFTGVLSDRDREKIFGIFRMKRYRSM